MLYYDRYYLYCDSPHYCKVHSGFRVQKLGHVSDTWLWKVTKFSSLLLLQWHELQDSLDNVLASFRGNEALMPVSASAICICLWNPWLFGFKFGFLLYARNQ